MTLERSLERRSAKLDLAEENEILCQDGDEEYDDQAMEKIRKHKEAQLKAFRSAEKIRLFDERILKLFEKCRVSTQKLIEWMRDQKNNRHLSTFEIKKYKSKFLRPKLRQKSSGLNEDELESSDTFFYATSLLECEVKPKDFIAEYREDIIRANRAKDLGISEIRKVEYMALNMRANHEVVMATIATQDAEVDQLEDRILRLRKKVRNLFLCMHACLNMLVVIF